MKKRMLQLFLWGILTFSSSLYATPQQNLIDAKITSVIYKKIAREKSISGLHLVVATKNRNVFISGMVNTMEDIHKIIEIATQLNEVKNIDMQQLKIRNLTS